MTAEDSTPGGESVERGDGGGAGSDRTLLAVFAHPDDEVGAAGTLLAHRARGDRVVILWLTRGEMTAALGPVSRQEIRWRRTEMGRRAGEILGAETRFLDFPDTRLQATPEAARDVAGVVAEVRPDAVVTFGEAWVRGFRHPDHQAAGKIARDAVTLARIRRAVQPLEPHRGFVPVFTYRDVHSRLPAAAVDVEPHLETAFELGRHYRDEISFGHPEWIERRLRAIGDRHGLEYAEEFDAWETEPAVGDALLPAARISSPEHPAGFRDERGSMSPRAAGEGREEG